MMRTIKSYSSFKKINLKNIGLSVLGLLALTLMACEKSAEDVETAVIKKALDGMQSQTNAAESQPKPIEKLPKADFKAIEWTDLMPQEDIDALLNPPKYVTDIEDGSFEDQIANQLQSSLEAASDDRYQQALVSTEVVEEMSDKPVRIPGFIVPLEFDDEQTITQFFLVPFFGACVHVPPPPPNQIIMVYYPEGLKVEALYDPVWIMGVLETKITANDMATAAYSMQMQYFEEYSEE